MTTPRDFKSYHFAAPEHWRTGLLAALTVSGRDGLLPERPLSPVPECIEVAEQGIESLAIDPDGVAYWVTGDGHLQWRGATAPGCPSILEASAGMANSPRLAFGKLWVWAFREDTPCLLRYDAGTLQPDREFAINREPASDIAILDIAADGRDGVWVLVSGGLYHVDGHGRPAAFLPIPGEGPIYRQLVYLSEARRLVLLSDDGLAVTLVEAASSASPSVDSSQHSPPPVTIHFEHEAAGFRAKRIDSDHRRRLLVVGTAPGHKGMASSTVLVMDSSAALIQRIAGNGLPQLAPHLPFLFATAQGDTAVLATAKRLFWFRFQAAAPGQRAVGTYLTPVLHSPDNDSLRGWLRAEVSAVLPKGSVLTATVLSTDDADMRDRVTMTVTSTTLSPSTRQKRVKDLLASEALNAYEFSAGVDTSAKGAARYPVPLFDRADRWLWLMIELTATPEGDLPRLRELRVIYPDISLAQHVPAIFRGDVSGRDPKAGDPSGFFRKLIGILETTTQGLDETIAALGQRIHPATAQGEWLDFVARWFDLPWDDALPESAKRRILGEASVLLATRGTRAGLSLLLEVLLPKATVHIVDVNVDFGLAVLGGVDCVGASLPAVLTGLADDAAVLSRRTILGQARLQSTDSDPVGVMPFTGILRIDIAAGDQERRSVEALLEPMVLAMIPAGLRLRIRWLPEMFGRSGQTLNCNFVLDNPSPRRLGQDARLGLIVLAGGRYTRLTEAGLSVGFQLK